MAKSREEYNEYMRVYMAARYHRRRSALIAKLGSVCVDCGGHEKIELDHDNASTKAFDIGKALAGWAQARIDAEAAKLVLRCKSCHLQKSIGDRGQVVGGRHGTISTYQSKKCRCELCVKAAVEARARWAARRKQKRQDPISGHEAER